MATLFPTTATTAAATATAAAATTGTFYTALYGEKSPTMMIIAFLLVVITFFFAMYYFYKGSSPNDLLPDLTPLNEPKDVGMPDMIHKKVLQSSGTSVMGFFKLLEGDRTPTMGGKDEFTPLMSVPQNWAIEVSPAPMQGRPYAVQLRVAVKTATTVKETVIPLPSIPYQKWVFVAVLREGRRCDVIYDNRIVASHRLEHYPVHIVSPLTVGHKRFRGSVIHVMVTDRRMTPTEVETERTRFVDTNGMIPEDHSIQVLFPKFTLPYFSECPPGLPCQPVTRPPHDNLLKWSTPYA